MIELVGTGIVITSEMVCEGCVIGILCMIQPWSPTLKVIGAMGGMVAYALFPYALLSFII